MTTETMRYVVAPTYKWYVHWCRDNDLDPRKQAKYVSRPEDARGVRLESVDQIVALGPMDSERYRLVLELKATARQGDIMRSRADRYEVVAYQRSDPSQRLLRRVTSRKETDRLIKKWEAEGYVAKAYHLNT